MGSSAECGEIYRLSSNDESLRGELLWGTLLSVLRYIGCGAFRLFRWGLFIYL